jgi:hypothetical protein
MASGFSAYRSVGNSVYMGIIGGMANDDHVVTIAKEIGPKAMKISEYLEYS